jgi:hypothetical protein
MRSGKSHAKTRLAASVLDDVINRQERQKIGNFVGHDMLTPRQPAGRRLRREIFGKTPDARIAIGRQIKSQSKTPALVISRKKVKKTLTIS